MKQYELKNECGNIFSEFSTSRPKLATHKRRQWSKFKQCYITESEIKLFEVRKKQIKAETVFKQFIRRRKQIKREENKSVEKFITKNNVPPWYRELSETQMAAADSLHTSIRDDLEQGTAHRCRQALLSLGLKPLINPADVRLALKMCAGSDFAFLWFLMELFYDKTCENCKHAIRNYTVNEQIIMSAICHLDMITTLRQLDRLLPLPGKAAVTEKERVKREKPKKSVSPYLQPLIRPVYRSKELYTKIVLPAVKIAPYDKYLDKSYLVANEATRWFKQGLQADTSANIEPSPRRSSVDIVSHFLEHQIMQVGEGNLMKDHKSHALCKTHEEERHLKKTIMQNIADINKYSQYESLGNFKKQKVMQQRVKALMETDQHNAQKKCEDLASKLQFETWLRIFVQDLILNIPDQTNHKLQQKFELLKEEATSLDKVLSRSCCTCNKCPYKSFQFDHQGTPKRTSIYFTAPRRNSPYVFHYEKIFQVDCTPKSEAARLGVTDIRNLYKFPTDNDEFWTEFEMGVRGRNGNTSMLQYTQQNLNNQLELYEVNPSSESKQPPLDYGGSETKNEGNVQVSVDAAQNYNPKSTSLMEKLLKNAFAKMKQDARFVLVTLPDAHRLPILVEWVRARYGNIYSKKQREDTLKKSLHHFEHLQNRDIKVSVPGTTDVWEIKDASYKDRDQIYCRTKTVKENYFHEVRLGLLDDARICWEVMKPYHCTSGPPRNIFYSYMPASEYDVLPFRPWKLCEFVDAASGFEKRRNLSKNKNKS